MENVIQPSRFARLARRLLHPFTPPPAPQNLEERLDQAIENFEAQVIENREPMVKVDIKVRLADEKTRVSLESAEEWEEKAAAATQRAEDRFGIAERSARLLHPALGRREPADFGRRIEGRSGTGQRNAGRVDHARESTNEPGRGAVQVATAHEVTSLPPCPAPQIRFPRSKAMSPFEEYRQNITRRHFFAQGSHLLGIDARQLCQCIGRSVGLVGAEGTVPGIAQTGDGFVDNGHLHTKHGLDRVAGNGGQAQKQQHHDQPGGLPDEGGDDRRRDRPPQVRIRRVG